MTRFRRLTRRLEYTLAGRLTVFLAVCVATAVVIAIWWAT